MWWCSPVFLLDVVSVVPIAFQYLIRCLFGLQFLFSDMWSAPESPIWEDLELAEVVYGVECDAITE